MNNYSRAIRQLVGFGGNIVFGQKRILIKQNEEKSMWSGSLIISIRCEQVPINDRLTDSILLAGPIDGFVGEIFASSKSMAWNDMVQVDV